MMKCVELGSPATIDSLAIVERDTPRPGTGQIMIRVRASSLNFHDYLVVTGILPAEPGRIPLSDGAGEIVELGDGVANFGVGERVMGTFYAWWADGPPTREKVALSRGDQVDGYAAEYVVVDASSVTRVPDGLSDIEAATLPCAAVTAWRAVFVESNIKPGDTVLVEGTGGVSLFALQFARMAGATVIGLSSTAEKLARLKSLGASEVVNYVEQPEWGKVVRTLTGDRGVDLAIEVVGGDLTQTMAAQKLGGKTALIGALSRKPINYASMHAIVGNRSVGGLTVGSREHQEDMVRAINANGLKPVIDRTFSLDEIKQAFRYQETKAYFGKITLAW
jgi:NADPH:quinone reductase-like Zn-dependent oxidoreductase